MPLDHSSKSVSHLTGLGVCLCFILGQDISRDLLPEPDFQVKKTQENHRTLYAVASPVDHQTLGLPWQMSKTEYGHMATGSSQPCPAAHQ